MAKKKKSTYEELYQMLKNSGTKPSREEVAKAYNQYDFETEDIAPITTGAIDIGVSNAAEIVNRKNVFNPIKGYDWMPSREATVDAPIFGSNKVKENVENLMSVYYNKDFPSKSGYVSTKADNFWDKFTSKYGMNYNDLQYEYINNLDGIRDEINKKAMSFGADTGKGASSYKEKALSYMTADEVAVYNYYYQTEGKEKAQEFLDALAETLNTRKANKEFESVEGKTAREILMGTVAGTEQFKQGVKNFGNMVVGKDDYIPQTSTQILTGKIREDLADDGVKVLGNSLGQFAYDALSTGTNMAPSIALGAMNPAAGAMLMGAGATGNAYQQDLNESGDKEKAKTYALAVGTLEGTLQYLLGGIGNLGGTSAAINNAVAGIKNGATRFLLEYSGKIGSEALEEGLQEVLAPIVKNAIHGTNENINWQEVAYSALLGGFMGAVSSGSDVRNTHLNANEHAVVDKVFKDAVKEQETSSGKKLTSKEKKNLYDKVLSDMEKGYIKADVIESVLGGENYKNLQTVIEQEQSIQKEYDTAKAEYDEINKLKAMERTGEQEDRRTELKTQLEEIKARQDEFNARDEKSRHRGLLDIDVWNQVKNTKLAETYLEKDRKTQAYESDLDSYTKENVKQTVQNFIDYGGNNTNASHDFMDLVTKVASDTEYTYRFLTTKQLEEAAKKGEVKLEAEAKYTEALIDKSKKEVIINMDSGKSLSSLVGHEVTHSLEGDASLYSPLQKAVFALAETRDEYNDRWQSIQRRYKGLSEEEQLQELASDLVGDYIFGDTDFVKNLATENPNVFQKIWNEIKYLWKMATAGSKEKRQLEIAKKKFEDAWRKAENTADSDTKFSVADGNIKVEVNDYHSGEMFATMSYTQDGKVVGTLEYSVYDGEPNVKMVEVLPEYRRKGIGTKLLQELQRNYPDVEINYGMTTPDGAKLLENATYTVENKEVSDKYARLEEAERKIEEYDKGYNHFYDNNLKIPENYAQDYDSLLEEIYQLRTELRGKKPTTTLVKGESSVKYYVSDEDIDTKIQKLEKEQIRLMERESEIKSNEEFQEAKKNVDFAETFKEKVEARKVLKAVQEKLGYNEIVERKADISRELTELQKQKKAQKEPFRVRELSESDYSNLKKHFGTTTNFNLAGYMLKDGTMLDFSGKHWGDTASDMRTVDHRDVMEAFSDTSNSGTEEMINMISNGNIRLMNETGGINLSKMPTASQREVLERYIRSHRGEVIVDIDAHGGDTVKSFMYDKGTAVDRIFRDIENYFNGGRQSDLMRFHSSYNDSDVRYSISEGMTSTERYNELKNKNISVAVAKPNEILDRYNLQGKSLNDVYKFVKENRKALGLNKIYSKDDIEIEFEYSNKGIKKSIKQTADNSVDERKYFYVLSCLDEIIDSSILIEKHSDKTDNAEAYLKKVYVLLGAYKKGEEVTPVQLEIKESIDNDNRLYLAVAIKESGVNVTTAMQDIVPVTIPDSSNISIQELVRKINPEAVDFLKYIPTEFLSKEQIQGKIKGLQKDVKKYPNSPFKEELEELEKQYDIAPTLRISDDDSYTSPAYGRQFYGKDLTLETDVPTIAPEEDIAPVAPEAPIEASIEAPIEHPTGYAPLTAEEAAERDAERAEAEAPKVGRVILEEEEQARPSRRNGLMQHLPELVLDKGFVFENLAKKTKNRELEARWNSTRYADARAQEFIGNGAEGVRSLRDIRLEVADAGLERELYDYLYHLHNIDRMTLAERYEDMENKPVFGESVTASVSRDVVSQLEAEHPELADWAEEIYAINNHLRGILVESGVISQETADLWNEMYPHYMPIRRTDRDGNAINVPLDTRRTGVDAPIKKAKGGNTDVGSVFITLAERTLQTYKAAARNRFGTELLRTLNSIVESTPAGVDDVADGTDTGEGILQPGQNGKAPTFTVFDNGERVTFEITDKMYEALKPAEGFFASTGKLPNAISSAHRGVLTEYNIAFMARNFIKDTQDVLINSQHPVETYKNIFNLRAIKEIARNGEYYQEYIRSGGEQNTYFDRQTRSFEDNLRADNKTLIRTIGSPIIAIGHAISNANNFIEKIPRMAEYIASRESGRSIDVSMLDAARVTTNFAAGGDLTKLLNRNGCTFLNASVQGLMQNVRNVREAKMNGLRGWAQLVAKCGVASVPAVIINALMWHDDEEYEELSDYVKQNFYVVGKFSDGRFVRIPKGRVAAVLQNGLEQMINLATGNDETDLNAFLDLVVNNLAPNNPLEDNIFAPIDQVTDNKTWYGKELVPTRLQDVPKEEQFDESTDALSKWLGEHTGASPYNINYLLQQYTGFFGDTIMPYFTPEAETADDSGFAKFIAPVRDAFVTDSVLKNQNVTDFYETADELKVQSNSSKATDEDILKNKYFSSKNTEIGKLYGEKRAIQSRTDLTDSEKYYLVRELQKQINEKAKTALNDHANVRINGSYATVGDLHYRLTDNGWTKLTDDQINNMNEVTKGLGITPAEYWNNKDEYDMQYKYPEKYKVLQEQGISAKEYKELYEESAFIYTDDYDWASKYPDKYSISKAISDDVKVYKQYMSELNEIKADKDSNGKTINGSSKKKKADYINSLDLDDGQKAILYRSLFDSKADKEKYNDVIIDYLNERDDISAQEMREILEALDMKVDAKGRITW